jgi:hypothetical protein
MRAGLDARYRVNSSEVTAKVLDGEAIVINLTDGAYYSLDGTGALVWAMAVTGFSGEEMAGELADRYGAPLESVRADVDRLLEKLVAERLLLPGAPDGVPGALPEGLADTGDYAPPELEKYTDMSEMLALDPPLPGIRDVPWQDPESGERS